MTNLELVLNMLAEATTTEISKEVLLRISWVTIMFENNIQIFIIKPLIPNRFLPSQSLNHFVWLCSGRNDAVYYAFKANAARTSL